ncbi:MAG: DUF2878 domain-containing protein [Pseudomonadota bacterium]
MADTLWQKAGNGTLFNLSWLAIVTTSSIVVAPVVVAIHLLIHQFWIGLGHRELLFVIAVSLFGVLLDQILFAVGLFTVDGSIALAPFWLSCLWPVLATTFQHAFAGLQQRLLIAAVLGGIGGYGSYRAGTALSAVEFADPSQGPLIVGALWVVLFPALALAARYWFTVGADAGEDEADAGYAHPVGNNEDIGESSDTPSP